ncbi:MAG TPA: phage major capsid protein [Beijerinckiaceae bacterium]|nr:phage major capsid protein [Beijerinckiaceae bacterium]
MKDLKKLRAQLSTLKAQGKAKTDAYNALVAQIEKLEGDAKAAEETKLAALETELDALAAQVETLAGEIEAEEKKARRQAAFAGTTAYTPARTLNEPDPATTGGFRSLAEFAVSVRNATVNHQVDPRLLGAAPANTMLNQGAAGEGFLVPAEFRQQIWEMVFSAGDLLSLVDQEPTNSNAVEFVKDETTPWGGSGVVAAWRAEGTQMIASRAATKGAMLQLNELYAFVVSTDELLADGPRLADRLTRKASEAIRWKASDAIMWGDGVGKPLGFMQSAAKLAVGKKTGQAAGTIVTQNVSRILSRLLSQNLGGAVWLANSDILPELVELQIGTQPMWTPPNAGLQNAPGGFLLGRPILFTEHAKSLGTEGDLTLVDPKGYYAATKAGGGIDFASSIHLYFDYGLTAFRWTFRMGGQPYLSGPVSPANGSATKSHFVTVETRS